MGLHRGLKALAFFRWRNSISRDGRNVVIFSSSGSPTMVSSRAGSARLGDIGRGAKIRGLSHAYDTLTLLTDTKEFDFLRQKRPEKAHKL